MGTEREENEQTSGDDDASQQDAASVSKDIFNRVLFFERHCDFNCEVIQILVSQFTRAVSPVLNP